MKREKWNRKTDLRNDPAESVSGAYEPEREYTLEEILSEFSGDRDSSGEQAWENEALPMSDFELDLFDRYEPAGEPAAESGPDSDYAPAAPIMEEESQITAEAVAPEALLTPENTAGPAEAGSEHIEPEALPGEKPKQSGTPEQSGKTEKTGNNPVRRNAEHGCTGRAFLLPGGRRSFYKRLPVGYNYNLSERKADDRWISWIWNARSNRNGG